jgi:ABC-type antimicrobial peptide transport system permease subunit
MALAGSQVLPSRRLARSRLFVDWTHEIGIRMALGASPRAVLGTVLGQGVRLAAAGVVAGLLGAVALTRAISTLLFGVSPRDPATLITLSLVLTAIALVACYVPLGARPESIRSVR